MKIINPSAVDVLGNEYRHGVCSNCGSEAIYLKKGPKVNKEDTTTEVHANTNGATNT